MTPQTPFDHRVLAKISELDSDAKRIEALTVALAKVTFWKSGSYCDRKDSEYDWIRVNYQDFLDAVDVLFAVTKQYKAETGIDLIGKAKGESVDDLHNRP